jgi:hypothetical protein
MNVVSFIVGIIGETAWSWVKLFFLANYGFLACIQLKNMRDAKVLNKYWTGIGYTLVPIFLFIDFLFNVIWGSIIFKELPKIPPLVKWDERELLFTDRCKRHFRAVQYYPNRLHTERTMKRYRAALRWKDRLNVVDPGHIY